MWTEERVGTLKKLWADGKSASHIAGRLGGITRNAVIGKVHRLGLDGRSTVDHEPGPQMRKGGHRKQLLSKKVQVGSAPATVSAASQAPVQYELPFLLMPTVKQPEAPSPIVETTSPAPLRVSLLDLKECMCRWPIGDPQSADFHFCARQKAGGSSYCEHHARIATRPDERKQG